MRKSWIGFGIVAGGATAIAAAPYFIDWNWFKPQLVSAVEAATGYDVEVAGNVGFSLLPTPRLSAETLTVRGFGASKSPLVTADKLSAAVAFLPLLSKKAEVKYIALERPVVRFVSYADGSNNWKAPGSSGDGSGGELSIEDFRIEDGSFVSEAADGSATQVDDINVQIEVASADGPYALDGSLRYGALPLKVKADYRKGGGVRVDAEMEDAGRINFVGQIGGAADGGAMPVSGRVNIDAATLGAFMAAFSDDPDDRSDAKAYRMPLKLAANVRGTAERLKLEGIRGKLAGGDLGGALDVTRGDRMSVNGQVALSRLDIADWRSDSEGDDKPFELPKAADADVIVRVADARSGDMKFGAVNAPLRLANNVLTLGRTSAALAGGGAMVVAGTLDAVGGKARFRGRFDMRLPRTAATLAALGTDGYASLPPLGLNGGIVYADDILTLGDLKGSLDGKPLAGRVRYPLAEGAAIDVVLALESLDMRRVVSRPSSGKSDAAPRPVNFNVKLGQFVADGSAYRGIAAVGTYADDKVVLRQASVADALGFGIRAKGNIDDVSGDRRVDLALSLAGEGVEGAVAVKGPMSRLDVGGAVTYAGAKLGLDGWVRTDPDTAYELVATARAPEAGVVLARLQDEPRAAKLGPLDLGMRIVGAGDSVKISNIAGKVGSMTLAGEASVNTAGEVPQVNAVLKAGVVPVTALLGDDGTGAVEAATGRGDRWSSEPLSFDWIKSFNGRITMTAERALYDSYVVEAPSLNIVSRGGTLVIESMKARMYGGNLAATGSLKAGPNQSLALKLALTDVPLEPLLKAAAATAPATGTLDFTGDFTARGGSQKALMSSLAGPVRIAAANGVIRKVDLKRLDEQLGDLRSVGSFVQFAGTALKGGETQYRMLAADLTGKAGRFTIDKVSTDMDGGSATARGYVDLGAYYADATAILSLGSHEDAPAIPATIKGALPSPEVKYTLGPLQTWFGKRLALVGLKAAVKGEGLDLGGLLGTKKPAADAVGETPAATADSAAAPKAQPKTVEEELGGVVAEGISQLFGKKKKPAAPVPAPTEEEPLEPVDLGSPN